MDNSFILTTAEKMAMNSMPKKPCLDDLPVEMLEPIFQRLGIQDLQEISKTTERLEKVAFAFYRRKFKEHEVAIKQRKNQIQPIIHPNDNCEDYFLETISNVTIYGNWFRVFDSLQNFGLRIAPKRITFKNLLRPVTQRLTEPNHFMKMALEDVETIKFIVNRFDGNLFSQIIKCCSKLKKIEITSTDLDPLIVNIEGENVIDELANALFSSAREVIQILSTVNGISVIPLENENQE